jgi:hypothetical protein
MNNKFLKFFNKPWLVGIAVIVSIIIISYLHGFPQWHSDGRWYIMIAQGDIENVIKPFSGRILHPYLVRSVSYIANVNLINSFILTNYLSLFLLVFITTYILSSSTKYPYIAFIILVNPVLVRLFEFCYLSELFHAALLSLLFLSMYIGLAWAWMLLLLFLTLTRDNTMILSFWLSFITWKRSQWKKAILIIVITLLGIYISSLAAQKGRPNVHNLPQSIYLLVKVPYNLLHNFTGIILWTNTYATNPITSWKEPPVAKIALPHWLQFGNITSIGIYRIDLRAPLHTLVNYFTMFGLAPTFLIILLLRYFNQIILKEPLYLVSAATFGLFCFLIGPAFAPDVDRLMAYGWPAFWIATPIWIVKKYAIDQNVATRLIMYHVILCWSPWVVSLLKFVPTFFYIVILLSAGLLQYLSFVEIKKLKQVY